MTMKKMMRRERMKNETSESYCCMLSSLHSSTEIYTSIFIYIITMHLYK